MPDKSTPPSLTDCICSIMHNTDDISVFAEKWGYTLMLCSPVATQERVENY